MTQERNWARAVLLGGAVFFAAPAMAQHAAVTPPPVAAAQPAPAAPTVTPPTLAPTAAPEAAPSAAQPRAAVGADAASPTPVNPDAAAQAAAEESERRATARRAAPRPSAAQPARASRADAPAPAPVAAAPVAPAPAAPAAQEAAPAPVAAEPATPASETATMQTETRTETSGSLLPLAILAAVIVAGLVGALLWRRRRSVEEEPVAYVEPTPVAVAEPVVQPAREPAVLHKPAIAPAAAAFAAAPVAVAPAVPEDATVHSAEAEDVAALTAGETHAGRPWIELAMRPVRAGTTADEALVEIELTVGNAGEVTAEDVRITTFMLPKGADTEMDRLLTRSRVDAAVDPITIAPGDGTRVDATLALPRGELMGHDATTFQPVVVADARYRLPDGSEGRTSASFLIGGSGEGGAFEQLILDRPVLRDDVEARLYREPARA